MLVQQLITLPEAMSTAELVGMKDNRQWTKPLPGSVNLPTPSKISLAFLPDSLSTVDSTTYHTNMDSLRNFTPVADQEQHRHRDELRHD